MKSSLFWTDTAELADLLSRVGGGSAGSRSAARKSSAPAAAPASGSAAPSPAPSRPEPAPAGRPSTQVMPPEDPQPRPASPAPERAPASTEVRPPDDMLAPEEGSGGGAVSSLSAEPAGPSFARLVTPDIDRRMSAASPRPAAPRAVSPESAVPASGEPDAAPGSAATASAATASAASVWEVPDGPVEARLDALLRWVEEHTGADTVFVVGEDGLAVAGQDSGAPELIAASAVLAADWESLRTRFDLAPFHAFAVTVGEERRLEVLSSPTDWGRLSLGFIPGRPVGENDIATLRQMFENALQERERASS